MHNICEFHSKKAKPLAGDGLTYETVEEGGVRIYRIKKAETLPDGQEEAPVDPALEKALKVTVGADTVVLEEPNKPNDDGQSSRVQSR